MTKEKHKNQLQKARFKAIVKRVIELRNEVKGFYSYALRGNPDNDTIRLFLFELAQQANTNVISKQGAIEACGKEIVDMALELFPFATIDDTLDPLN